MTYWLGDTAQGRSDALGEASSDGLVLCHSTSLYGNCLHSGGFWLTFTNGWQIYSVHPPGFTSSCHLRAINRFNRSSGRVKGLCIEQEDTEKGLSLCYLLKGKARVIYYIATAEVQIGEEVQYNEWMKKRHAAGWYNEKKKTIIVLTFANI